MGVGFNLFFIFILVPLTAIFLLVWLIIRKKIIGIILGLIWLGIFVIIFLSQITKWLTAKKELDKNDYYGEYVVAREFFHGRQADWQYENFRFEIKENDSIYFYVIDKERVLKLFRGTIKTTKPYNSERLIINMEQPTHHIVTSNPTTYRDSWSFYLVFNSPKFHNLYFKKAQWKPIVK